MITVDLEQIKSIGIRIIGTPEPSSCIALVLARGATAAGKIVDFGGIEMNYVINDNLYNAYQKITE